MDFYFLCTVKEPQSCDSKLMAVTLVAVTLIKWLWH